MENQENIEKKEEEKRKKEEKTEKVGKFSYFFELIKVIFWALIIIIPIRTFLFQPFFVQGASMEPNFHNGEYLIVNELGYKETEVGFGDKDVFKVSAYKNLQRGDVIVFKYPKNPREFFIKRVIGLPNEKIIIRNGKIEVYNKENPGGIVLSEGEYLPTVSNYTDCNDQECAFEIGSGEYLVLGDNRSRSSDSRTWGLLDQEYIIGKVLLRAWPLSKIGLFD